MWCCGASSGKESMRVTDAAPSRVAQADDRYPVLSRQLVEELRRVPSSKDREMEYKPCAVTLVDGSELKSGLIVSKALLMRWTAPHKASRCRRVIVEDESPERAVHDNNYHHRARPCKEGVASPRRRCRGQGRRRPQAPTQGGVGILRQASGVSGRHGGLRQCALLGA